MKDCKTNRFNVDNKLADKCMIHFIQVNVRTLIIILYELLQT